jgi:hypothetical protein
MIHDINNALATRTGPQRQGSLHCKLHLQLSLKLRLHVAKPACSICSAPSLLPARCLIGLRTAEEAADGLRGCPRTLFAIAFASGQGIGVNYSWTLPGELVLLKVFQNVILGKKSHIKGLR